MMFPMTIGLAMDADPEEVALFVFSQLVYGVVLGPGLLA
jgi:hypothetical protein